MQTNIARSIQKIFTAFYMLNNKTKKMIKYGTQISLLVLIAGTVLLFVNQTVLNFDVYYEFISTSVIKASFTILAEVIIGGLLIDYIFNKG